MRSGGVGRGVLLEGGGVVLEPGEAQRRVEPHAAQEAELADRLGDVRRQPLPGDDDQHDVADAAVEAAGDPGDPEDVGDAEHRPPQRRPQRRPPAHRGDRGPVALACLGPPLPQRRADARHAHLLGRPGRGADEEQVSGQALVDGNRLLGGPLDAGPPHRREHGRRAGEQQQRQGRMDRAEQQRRHHQPQHERQVRQQRLEEVVERERRCRAARRGGRGTRGAPGARPWPPSPAAGRCGTPWRWRCDRGSAATAAR